MRKHDHGQVLPSQNHDHKNGLRLVKAFKKTQKTLLKKFDLPEFPLRFNTDENVKSLSTGSSENLGRSLEDEDEYVDYEDDEEEEEELEDEEEEDYESYNEINDTNASKENDRSFGKEISQIYAKNVISIENDNKSTQKSVFSS